MKNEFKNEAVEMAVISLVIVSAGLLLSALLQDSTIPQSVVAYFSGGAE